MKKVSLVLLAVACFALGYVVSNGTATLGAAESQSENPVTGSNYLYMMDFEFGYNMTPNDGIAEASKWVREMRNTGEYKTVRLYIHNTGPKWAVYILAEPKSWESIEKGAEKLINALDFMNQPNKWAGHADDLLSEIPVK
jgi:hypothetical protein